jgi:hypothetical protein
MLLNLLLLSINELEVYIKIKAMNLRLKWKCGVDIDVSMEIVITQHGKTQYKMLIIGERQEKTLNPNAKRTNKTP